MTNLAVSAPDTVVENNVAAGIDEGAVTLAGGGDPAARVATVTGQRGSTLTARAKPLDKLDKSYSWGSYFAWDGEASAWDLVFEWRIDPGVDLQVDYIVNRPQATVDNGTTSL